MQSYDELLRRLGHLHSGFAREKLAMGRRPDEEGSHVTETRRGLRAQIAPQADLLPASADRRSVCLRPSCFNVDPPRVGSVDAITAPPCGGILHLPQGPSLGSGL